MVMVFFSQECPFSLYDDLRVTVFKRSLKHFFHLSRISSSFLSKISFWCLMDLAVIDLFPWRSRMPDVLLTCFVGLFVIEIYFMMSAILPKLHFGLFTT